MCGAAVTAPAVTLHTSHPPPSRLWQAQRFDHELRTQVSPLASFLHPVQSAMMTQFPDPRLIQYDCGKFGAPHTLPQVCVSLAFASTISEIPSDYGVLLLHRR